MNNTDVHDISSEEGINIKDILERYLFHWRWILLSIVFCIGIAYVYLRYTNPTFASKATVLIKDDKAGSGFSEMDMMKELGFGGGSGSLENEIEIYKSRSILEKVVRNLQINKSVVAVGDRSGLERAELYDKSPVYFDFKVNDSTSFTKTKEFELRLVADATFELKGEGETELKPVKAQFNSWRDIGIGQVRVLKTEEFSSEMIGRRFILRIAPVEKVVTDLKSQLNVSAVNKDADILNISIQGEVIKKNNDILNEVIKQHRKNAIADKNEVAENTSNFINKRLELIQDQLREIENEGE
ncbi:Wzz/FepE/Etk N-terminal domain-containing protein, partial [Lishizhenia sp.]|uniref:Wzz/FepE/Etk N-terminal domain-containing protein n=1 Tax=Lishizhenia sp. TaxID=2497594 RepID=UPI00299E425E